MRKEEKTIDPLECYQEFQRQIRQPCPSKPIPWRPLGASIALIDGGESGEIKKYIKLPDYGEVIITCHAGKVTTVKTTTTEKVE